MRWSNALHAILILLLGGPALAGRPEVVHPKIMAIHELLATKAGAVVWLKRDERGAFTVDEVLPLRQPLRMWLYPEPMGEGTWIQLMTRNQRPMGTFRAAIPEPGASCGVEIPLVRGAWWLLIYDEHHGMRRLLAHLEVGRKLAYVARRNRLPVLGATKPPRVARPPAGSAR
ncbi:MAG: hypothetical protein GXP47_04260 [Acidobacteria bacterium]|nr:hypothetical protein [Acidobacteriota bacterium]